jgi:hypothetical protein
MWMNAIVNESNAGGASVASLAKTPRLAQINYELQLASTNP